jgi:type III restriction enzyme
LATKAAKDYERRADNLKRTLVDHGGMSPIGLLRECLEFAKKGEQSIGLVFESVNAEFQKTTGETFDLVSRINSFRNTYVAHQKKELTEAALARAALTEWCSGLRHLWRLFG